MTERITATKLLESRIDDLEYYKKRVKIAKANKARTAKTIDFIYRSLAVVEDRVSISIWDDINAWTDDPEHAVTLYVNVSAHVISMKTGLVPDLMATLLNFNYDARNTQDRAADSQRIFEFVREANEHFCRIHLTFTAIIKEDSEGTCHRVQVGTKTVEVPEYKLVCEEAA